MTFDPAQFFDDERVHAKKVATALVNDPYFFASGKKWAQLSLDDRKAFVDHFARSSASALGVFNPSVSFYNEPKNEKGQTSYGYFTANGSMNSPTLYINEHPDAYNNFGGIIQTIAHENTHYRQYMLRNDNTNPERAAFLKTEKQNYIQPEKNYAAYKNQFVERHADMVGDTVSLAGANILQTKTGIVLKDEIGNKLLHDYEKGHSSTTGVNAVTITDPRAHYYSALLAQKELSRPGHGHANDAEWYKLIDHCEKAIKFGEFAHGFDPNKPAKMLHDLALSLLEDQRADTPLRHRKEATKILGNYSASPRDALRIPCKRYLSSIEKYNQNILFKEQPEGTMLVGVIGNDFSQAAFMYPRNLNGQTVPHHSNFGALKNPTGTFSSKQIQTSALQATEHFPKKPNTLSRSLSFRPGGLKR